MTYFHREIILPYTIISQENLGNRFVTLSFISNVDRALRRSMANELRLPRTSRLDELKKG